MPTFVGVAITTCVLLVSAGATIFFLTRAPDDQRLLKQGESELATGQYAFAVRTLTHATTLRPNDAKAFLLLARAYVGVDQVDKAWQCISHAQQLGKGPVAEPSLASDLANYYRQRGHYDKAIELLRPLAKANVPGKRAELADLDALWGDQALRDGQTEVALRCWEEVRELRDGSRFGETESRLSTIYQKLASASAANNDDSKALDYLDKLNYIAQNPKNYQLAASIYERDGKLDLAIEQIRKAVNLDPHNQALGQELSSLLSRRGKEMIESGNSEGGYAYLQQAKSLSPASVLPEVTLRSLNVGFDSLSKLPKLTGEVWNPTDKTVNSISIRAELWDNLNEKMLWSKDNRIVDEFVPPLTAKQSRSFEFLAQQPVKSNGESEFRVYLDGVLYKTYVIGKAPKEKSAPQAEIVSTPSRARSESRNAVGEPDALPNAKKEHTVVEPAPAAPAPHEEKPIASSQQPAETPGTTQETQPIMPPAAVRAPSAEEKTMKDLDF
jgi:tetratricopeptide (TPR) repeat protein